MTAESSSADAASLLIWDSREEPPANEGIVYRWSGREENGGVRSVMQYVEAHGERLRAKYLAWIHDLGELRIRGQRLIDRLAYDDSFSYWWMTLLVEKDPYKSPITDAIRLLALDEIVSQVRPDRITLASASKWLHETVRDLCESHDIAFEGISESRRKRDLSLRSIYRTLPRPLQAAAYLVRFTLKHRRFKRAKKQQWLEDNDSIFICSYLDNLDKQALEEGKYYSYYWQDLHGLLKKSGYKSNWLHIHAASANVPDAGIAVARIDHINRSQQNRESHNFVDAFFSLGVLFRVLGRIFWLIGVNMRLKGVKKAFRPQNCGFSMWPLMRGDWSDSMRGPVAANNLMKLELFDRAVRSLPYLRKGLFLYENQAWERALCRSWRKYGQGQLIAVAHTTVRFWDLRYFTDLRTIRSSEPYFMPQPDLVALNGKAAVDAYNEAGYTGDSYVECEALRFGHLNDMQMRDSAIEDESAVIRVLILGDYLSTDTANLLRMLEAAAPHMPGIKRYTVKPHPNCTVEREDYPSLDLDVVTDPLGDILNGYDCAYCSALTTAALDAYLAGLPVVVRLDDDELNFSPLRGVPGASFVGTSEELVDALKETRERETRGRARNEFFYLDPELAKWSRLLAS